MLFYIVLFLFLLIIGIYTDKEIISINDKTIISQKFYAKIMCFILLIIACIRYNIGTDYDLYQGIYESGIEKQLELGWLYFSISNLLRNIGLDYQFLLFLNSAIFMIAVYFLIQKYSPYKYISILILLGSYTYFSSLNTFRQFSSISLIILALILFYKYKKIIFAFLIILFAIGLHKSAIVFLPLFIFKVIKIRLTVYQILLWVCLCSFFLLSEELKSLIFNQVLNMNAFFGEKYTGSVFIADNNRSLVNQIFYLFYWIVTFTFVQQKKNRGEKLDWIESCFLLYFILNSFLPYSTLVIRLNYLFSLLSVIIFPRFILLQNKSGTRNIIKIIVIIIFFIRMISVLMNNGDGVVPYETIFNNFE